MNNLEEKIMFIANCDLGISMSGRYTNAVSLNGFILQKPRFIINEKHKNESCSFIIHQISRDLNGRVADKTYGIITYLPKVIDRLRGVNKVCFITCVGRLEKNPVRKSDYFQMFDFEISCFLDEEMEETYERKTK